MKTLLLTSFLVVILLSLLLVGCSTTPTGNVVKSQQSSTLNEIKSTSKMTVGYASYPPYVEKNLETGELTGYAVDVMNEIGSQMKVEIIWIESSWQSYASDLQTEKFDVFVGPLFSTIERSMEVNFIEPIGYFSGLAGIVESTDNRFNSIMNLNQEEVTIAVPQGWLAHEYAIKNLNKANIRSFKQEGATLALSDVLAGNSDIALADGPTVQQYLEKNSDQNIKAVFLDEPIVIIPASFSIKKGDSEWKEFLDQAIFNLRIGGDLKRIASNYKLYSLDVKQEFIQQ